jgi:hypothetical protein
VGGLLRLAVLIRFIMAFLRWGGKRGGEGCYFAYFAHFPKKSDNFMDTIVLIFSIFSILTIISSLARRVFFGYDSPLFCGFVVVQDMENHP